MLTYRTLWNSFQLSDPHQETNQRHSKITIHMFKEIQITKFVFNKPCIVPYWIKLIPDKLKGWTLNRAWCIVVYVWQQSPWQSVKDILNKCYVLFNMKWKKFYKKNIYELHYMFSLYFLNVFNFNNK